MLALHFYLKLFGGHLKRHVPQKENAGYADETLYFHIMLKSNIFLKKKFGGHMSLFWTSGDVSRGFQRNQILYQLYGKLVRYENHPGFTLILLYFCKIFGTYLMGRVDSTEKSFRSHDTLADVMRRSAVLYRSSGHFSRTTAEK